MTARPFLQQQERDRERESHHRMILLPLSPLTRMEINPRGGCKIEKVSRPRLWHRDYMPLFKRAFDNRVAVSAAAILPNRKINVVNQERCGFHLSGRL